MSATAIKTYSATNTQLSEDQKLASQAKVVYDVICSKGPISRQRLVTAVDKKLEGKTNQTGDRIVSYYAKTLVDLGLITIENVEPAKRGRKAKAATTAE